MALSRLVIRLGGRFLLVAGIMTMTSCTRQTDNEALEAFIQATLAREPSRLPLTPVAPTVDRFVYSAAGLRSPFEQPPALEALMPLNAGVSPDFLRNREALESSSFSDLSMVGFLSFDGQILALVESAEGELFRVSVGSYLGLNHGRVWRVRREGIDLVEIVPSGDGGWIERPQILAMRQRIESAGAK
jgi:type IV pilus assembly protein PilP